MNVELADVKATQEFGESLAKLLHAGDVVALHGTLGAGKTTLVQGLAWGLGLARTQYAPSPTYAVALTYPTTPALNHLDLYRLESGVGVLLGNDYFSPDAITVVEWPERAPEWMPETRFELSLQRLENEMRLVSLHSKNAALAERICVWRASC